MGNNVFGGLSCLERGTNKATKDIHHNMNIFKIAKGRIMSNIHLPKLTRHKTTGFDSCMRLRQKGKASFAGFNYLSSLFTSDGIL